MCKDLREGSRGLRVRENQKVIGGFTFGSLGRAEGVGQAYLYPFMPIPVLQKLGLVLFTLLAPLPPNWRYSSLIFLPCMKSSVLAIILRSDPMAVTL